MKNIQKVIRNNERGYSKSICGGFTLTKSDQVYNMQKDINTLLTYFQKDELQVGQNYQWKDTDYYLTIIFIYNDKIFIETWCKDNPNDKTICSPLTIDTFKTFVNIKEYTLVK